MGESSLTRQGRQDDMVANKEEAILDQQHQRHIDDDKTGKNIAEDVEPSLNSPQAGQVGTYLSTNPVKGVDTDDQEDSSVLHKGPKENGVLADDWRDVVRRSPVKRPPKMVTLSPRHPRRQPSGDAVRRAHQ